MQALLEKEQNNSLLVEQDMSWSASPGQSHQRLLRGYLHKTSNSLCGIKGYASLIAGLGQEIGENSNWARKIISEVEKMEMIFATVDELTTQRRGAGLARDPEGVLDYCLDQVQERHPKFSVKRGQAPACSLILPAADLEQVLKAVLDNAAEGADGRVGQVWADVRWEINARGRIVLGVSDDAGGIPLHLGSQVRNPFVTAKPGHVGIGLSRVETILDMHGLDWSLESDHGKGTTVTMEVATPTEIGVALARKASDGA